VGQRGAARAGGESAHDVSIAKRLVRRVPHRVPAVVPGWRVAALQSRVVPGPIRGQTSATGLLNTDLTVSEWHVLDAFKDETYDLRSVTLPGGGVAWAYVRGDNADWLVQDWEAGRFASHDLSDFLPRCVEWRSRYKLFRGHA
jgi:gamma-glutamyl AIG2-like cyclotransferase